MSRYWINSWLQAVRKRRPAAGFRPNRFAPQLEVLEDRSLPSTFLVTNLNDSGPGSLRAAVTTADANPGSTINFAAGLKGTISLTRGQLNISSSMNINGPGASVLSVSSSNASRVFDVSGGTSDAISGLTIANGLADQGAGIDNLSSLTLNNDVFSGNEAVGDSSSTGIGGAMFNEAGASLSVNGCTFTNNQAVGKVGQGDGGGIQNEGSASISASTFTSNQATGGSAVIIPGGPTAGLGGAINNEFGGILNLSNSTFTDNLAVNGQGNIAAGGAIDTILNSSLTVSSCTFAGNQVQANGSFAASGSDA
jgi:hypothetical protein